MCLLAPHSPKTRAIICHKLLKIPILKSTRVDAEMSSKCSKVFTGMCCLTMFIVTTILRAVFIIVITIMAIIIVVVIIITITIIISNRIPLFHYCYAGPPPPLYRLLHPVSFLHHHHHHSLTILQYKHQWCHHCYCTIIAYRIIGSFPPPSSLPSP